MGVMRFLIYPENLIDNWPEVEDAYICGFDGRVFPTRIEVNDNVLSCLRQQSDSGKVHVCWPVEGFGRPVICTSSLPERELPYALPLELARGKICQVRDQLAQWEMGGMVIPEGFLDRHRKAHKLFGAAVAQQADPQSCAELAQAAIVEACHASQALAESYTEQRLNVRRKRSSQIPVQMGCHLSNFCPDEASGELFLRAFNAVSVPISWGDIEPEEGSYCWETTDAQVDWCSKQRLSLSGGPVLDFSPGGLPEWLSTWSHDVLNLQSFVCDFVETAVTRYAGRIRQWEVSAHVNTGGALALSEENRLALVARSLEVARQVDEENQLSIRVDRPWGDYQSRGQHRLSPLQFVDALVRSGVGLSGVNLEIAMGFDCSCRTTRGLIDVSRLVDLWSCLGIPLTITLAFPSSTAKDDLANHQVQLSTSCPDAWTETTQALFIEQYLPLLMAKQNVVGCFWTHFSDASEHRYPNAGLIGASADPKAAFGQIVSHREAFGRPDLAK